jgi:hypothetical protein
MNLLDARNAYENKVKVELQAEFLNINIDYSLKNKIDEET